MTRRGIREHTNQGISRRPSYTTEAKSTRAETFARKSTKQSSDPKGFTALNVPSETKSPIDVTGKGCCLQNVGRCRKLVIISQAKFANPESKYKS